MRYYVRLTNGCGCVLEDFEIDCNKSIASELIRVIEQNGLFLCEDDRITFIAY